MIKGYVHDHSIQPLTAAELKTTAGLLTRAVKFHQCAQLVEACNDLGCEVTFSSGSWPTSNPSGMSDASKRLRDPVLTSVPADEDSFELADFPDEPQPSSSKSIETNEKDPWVNASRPLPERVKSSAQWGRTLVTMPKYASRKFNYKDIIEAARAAQGPWWQRMIQSMT